MNITVWFSRLSIRRKVQYVFMLAIGVCVLFCFIFFLFLFRSKMTESVLEKSRDNLSSISQNFASVVDNVNNISRLVMVNDSVISYLKSKNASPTASGSARFEIYNILNSFSRNCSVFVIRNDRNSIYTGIGIIYADYDVIYSDEWYGRVSKAAGGYVLLPNTNEAFTANAGSNDIISFARIINDLATQMPIGILVINIPVSEFENTYRNLADNDNHFAYLDTKGNVICADADFQCSAKASHEQKIVQIPENDRLTERVVSSAIMLDSGISAISVSRVRIMGDVSEELLVSAAVVMLIAILLFALMNFYISRYITVPISKLASSMQNSDAVLPERVSIRCGRDEIGKLQDSYNQMLTQIRRLIDELLSEEQNRQKAEMDALQEQIKPHFLYNTLETISYMSLQQSPEEVYNAIETLGNFYRKFLSKGSQTITLAEEISIVKDYIRLQKLRYDDMFDDCYNIEEGLEGIYVPKLILQPLVENSIYHGIRPKGEKCTITVTACRVGDDLKLTVHDSGIGMNGAQISRLLYGENTKSFGFKGTIDRIRYFSDRRDVVKIRSTEGEFCEIEITMPISSKTGE